jgi:hypothetical protein
VTTNSHLPMKKIFLIAIIAFSFVLAVSNLPDLSNSIQINKVMAQDIPGEGGADDPGFMFDLGIITHEDIAGSSRQKWIREGINYIFERIIGVMAATIGGLAVLVMSFGGFLILSSAGSQTQRDKGISYIKYSLIGLAVTLGAYILVSAVQILIRSIYG